MVQEATQIIQDTESGPLLSAEIEEEEQQSTTQPKRSKIWWKTTTSLVVVGLIAALFILTPPPSSMQPAPELLRLGTRHPTGIQQKWGSYSLTDVWNAGASVVNGVKDVAVSAYNGGANAAQAYVCDHLVPHIDKLKDRWAEKMAKDVQDPANPCHTDRTSAGCKAEFVKDACAYLQVSQTLQGACENIFGPVADDVLQHASSIVLDTATALHEKLVIKNELAVNVGARLDAQVHKICPGRHLDKAWANLTVAEQGAATALGYTQPSWDANQDPPATTLPYDQLNATQKMAVIALGYTQSSWDAS